MPVVSCSGWSNDAITWGNPIRYADSVQTNTNRNRISSLLTLDPRFEGVRIQCVRLHDRAIRRRGSPRAGKLDSVCTEPKVWADENIPQQWRDAKIVTIYKNKGDKTICGNHRG